MKRKDFVKLAINNPQRAADILKANAKQLANSRNVSKTAEVLSKTLFISDRTVFRDCKK